MIVESRERWVKTVKCCANCDAALNSVKTCSGCNVTYYCSKDCQRKHTGRFKSVCKVIQHEQQEAKRLARRRRRRRGDNCIVFIAMTKTRRDFAQVASLLDTVMPIVKNSTGRLTSRCVSPRSLPRRQRFD